MAESTVNRYDIKAPCLQFIKISKSTLDVMEKLNHFNNLVQTHVKNL